MTAVDIILPTNGKRPDGLAYQIDAILNQSYKNIKLWVLNDTCGELILNRKDDRLSDIDVPDGHHGNAGHNAIKWALQSLPLQGEWIYLIGDDDCLAPWAIDELVSASDEKTDMVVAFIVAVHRDHNIATEILGSVMELGKITGSCCLFRASKLKEFGWDNSGYTSDWITMKKFIDSKAEIRKIRKVIAIMPQYG